MPIPPIAIEPVIEPSVDSVATESAQPAVPEAPQPETPNVVQLAPVQSPIAPSAMPTHGQTQQPNQPQSIQLADIHLPAKPAFWPPAPGWWVLTALVIGLLTLGVMKLLRYRRLKIQQKQILTLLGDLEMKLKREKTPQALAEINILLRRLALMHYPRQKIASLTGKNWLTFLDRSGRTHDFTQGAGRLLADVPYLAQMPESADIQNLIKVVTRWVEQLSSKPVVTMTRAMAGASKDDD